MNNYKRTKEWINSLEDDWSRVDIDWEAVDEIRELVDKETPMKPNYHYDHSCGNCGSQRIKDFNDFVNEKYCSNCGQKIDWSENE